MIAALFLLLQQAAPPSLSSVTIRNGDRASAVAVALGPKGPVVDADAIATALDGRVESLARGEFAIAVAGMRLVIAPNVALVHVGDETLSLPSAPVLRTGKLYVPYAVVSEVLPRLSPAITFDARRAVLERRVTPTRTAAAPNKAPFFTVVVDAGHGGPDRGMHGPIGASWEIREKDITLDVARALRDSLTARGVAVIMTRTSDTLIALSDRGRIANSKKGDLFISIHVNAANPRWKKPGAARGFETYFLSEARTEDAKRVEAMENEVVKYEIGNDVAKDDPLSFIVHDMEQNQHLRESSELAETVQRSLATMHPGPNRGVKQAGFRVLVTAFMPAVLVEIGFGTNPAEARFLKDSTHQRQIASAIATATMEYLAAYQRRAGATGQ